jgi:hypothetical protein
LLPYKIMDMISSINNTGWWSGSRGNISWYQKHLPMQHKNNLSEQGDKILRMILNILSTVAFLKPSQR